MPSKLKFKPWTKEGPPNPWRKPDGMIDYDRVVNENINLIKWVFNRLGIHSKDIQEDRESEMKLTLCRAAELWDPAIAKWSTYAIRSLIMRSLRSRKKAYEDTVSSLPAQDWGDMRLPGNHRLGEVTPEIRDLLAFMLDGLSSRDREVVTRRFIYNETLRTIGNNLKPPVTRERVRQIIMKAIGRMQTEAAKHGLLPRISGASNKYFTEEKENQMLISGSIGVFKPVNIALSSTDVVPGIGNVEIDKTPTNDNIPTEVPASARRRYEFDDLVQDGDFVLCPECGTEKLKPVGLGITGHLWKAHKIKASIMGAPATNVGKRVHPTPCEPSATVNGNNLVPANPRNPLVPLAAQIGCGKTTHITNKSLTDESLVVIQEYHDQLSILTSPAARNHSDESFIKGIVVALHLLTSKFPDLKPYSSSSVSK